ncbi:MULTISPECIES: hypothetical protein [Staphylococcus]|uniref:hypothetical protein n=1 Tax=Staphylococcus TaxID=1279 RepID=UPI000853AF6D|nr:MULTISPECIES: hypothetical protein [Staphylococcus]MBN6756170.1 hypothetical protein [Staphylococcus saprophyticus]MBN6766148.1 hypothetical protein [Staphylococcus saprophyticus]MBN6770951.1 hypothetical protein [Staphylococcus saprophyticus]MBN6780483.1 hypothetical protein [Staphylococcus saprophyticus]MBN6787914.1 hypothetical protein [Staphylococcus saprophyticus]
MNKRYIIMSLIGTILSIAFVCLCGWISIKFKQGVPLEILLLSIGLFATFGGAYYGAKVSGDNARELYEKQKDDDLRELHYKNEFMLSIKLSKVLDAHDKLMHYSIYCEDNLGFENDDKTLNLKNTLAIYANPIIEILKDKNYFEITKQITEELAGIVNDCNKYLNAFNSVNIEKNEPTIISTNSKYKLSGRESDELADVKIEFEKMDSDYENKHVVAYFIHRQMDNHIKMIFNNMKVKGIENLFLNSNSSQGFENEFNLR